MSNGIEKFVKGFGFVPDDEKAAREFKTEAPVTNGVVRWNANGNVPPRTSLLSGPVWASPSTTRRPSRPTRRTSTPCSRPSTPCRPRMRAAFGPNTTVVNILTGRRTRL